MESSAAGRRREHESAVGMYYGALRDQAQLVFEHPLRERLAEHRPLVVDAEPPAELGAIGLPTLTWTISVVTWRRW